MESQTWPEGLNFSVSLSPSLVCFLAVQSRCEVSASASHFHYPATRVISRLGINAACNDMHISQK